MVVCLLSLILVGILAVGKEKQNAPLKTNLKEAEKRKLNEIIKPVFVVLKDQVDLEASTSLLLL